MEWIEPGMPIEIKIAGRKVTIKFLTALQRIAFVKMVRDLEVSEDSFKPLIDKLATVVEKIDGQGEHSTADYLAAQPPSLILAVCTAVVGKSKVSDNLGEESASLSDGSEQGEATSDTEETTVGEDVDLLPSGGPDGSR